MEKQSVPPRSRSFQLFGQNTLRGGKGKRRTTWFSDVVDFKSLYILFLRYYGRRSRQRLRTQRRFAAEFVPLLRASNII